MKVDAQLRLGGAERPPVAECVTDSLLAGNVIPGGASGVMVRTDLVRELGGFDPALSNLADYDLWIRLGLAAPVAVVDRPLVGYRVHPSGMAHNVRRSEEELAYIEEKYRTVRRSRGVTVQRERFLWYFGALSLRRATGFKRGAYTGTSRYGAGTGRSTHSAWHWSVECGRAFSGSATGPRAGAFRLLAVGSRELDSAAQARAEQLTSRARHSSCPPTLTGEESAVPK